MEGGYNMVDPVTAATLIATLISIGMKAYDMYKTSQEEAQEKQALQRVKVLKEQQIVSDVLAFAQSTQFKLQALNQQLLQARNATLLEQYERYKQGLRDKAMAIVTQYAAGIKGGTATAEQLAAELDRDKDINILKRNYLNVAKQLGLEKEIALHDLNTAITNAILSYKGVEQAQTLAELDLAARYRSYYTQTWASIASEAAQAYSTWKQRTTNGGGSS